MNVVLISPYSGIEATGLRMISACLKQAGFATRMIFLPNLEEVMAGTGFGSARLEPNISRQIGQVCAQADLIGLTVMTPSFRLASRLTQALRASSTAPIIWGGVHPTVCPDECLAFADLVCLGEGERTMVELARRISDSQDYHDLGNLAYRDVTGSVVMNPLFPLETDLDRLPFADYDFQDHLVVHEGELVPLTQDLMHFYLTDLGSWARGPVYRTMATRGCPYRCTYCANDALVKIYPGWSRIRRRSPVSVVEEIQAVRRRLPGIEAIVLNDDTFLANSEAYIDDFCQRYRQAIGLPFRVYTTAQTADTTKLSLLAQAGLRYVIMGIQTGSPRTQEQYRRHAKNEQLLRAARLIHAFQAWIPRPTYDVITDNPSENEQDRWETLRLIHQLPPPYRLSLYSLTIYPGTGLWHAAEAGGGSGPSQRSPYEHNFQRIEPNFFNFTLYCHSLNLPRLFLSVLARRAIFHLGSTPPFDWLFGRLMVGLLGLRLWSNRWLYARRRAEWRVGARAARHV